MKKTINFPPTRPPKGNTGHRAKNRDLDRLEHELVALARNTTPSINQRAAGLCIRDYFRRIGRDGAARATAEIFAS